MNLLNKKNKIHKMKANFLAIDLDNTICIKNSSDYENSKPIKNITKILNKLKRVGRIINLFTSSHIKKCNGDIIVDDKILSIKDLKKFF